MGHTNIYSEALILYIYNIYTNNTYIFVCRYIYIIKTIWYKAITDIIIYDSLSKIIALISFFTSICLSFLDLHKFELIIPGH